MAYVKEARDVPLSHSRSDVGGVPDLDWIGLAQAGLNWLLDGHQCCQV